MLTPVITFAEDEETVEAQDVEQKQPLKTYEFDFNTGEFFARFIDERKALKQFIVKALATKRNNYLIYTENYGSEIYMLMNRSHSRDYLRLEIPRLVKEALMINEYIQDCINFDIMIDDNTYFISFEVISDTGNNLQVEVSV